VSTEPKPPGHTCPEIDRAQHVLRQLAWRIRNRPSNHYPEEEVAALLREGLAVLENVRAENAAMRDAHAYMQKKTAVMERVIGALGGS
jgi:hypothetical protein